MTASARVSASPRSFASLADAVKALQDLDPGTRSTGAWALPQVLHHLAQSVEYSMSGFPQPKPAWFQATLGRAAFAFFEARGRMSHGLAEPIPGAPALPADATRADGMSRLLQALQQFAAYDGPLRPHFAYGALDKPAYTRAHLMHLADHWTEFTSKETS